jgi:sec-independent protein translocase protein TatC
MAVADDGLSPETRADLGLTGRANPQARMPLLEHLRELRNRIIKVALAITVGAVIGWVFYKHVFAFIQQPFCKLPAASRALPGAPPGSDCSRELYVTGVFDGLLLKLQLSVAVGLIISSPVWLYQLWAFIAPGLYKRERRWAYYFVGAALPLFAVGATIAYFAMTKGLKFLLSSSLIPSGVTPLITITTYLSYAGAMLVIFGLAFEMPLVFVLLNMAGVLTHERFRKWRRMIIFLVFAFAAIFTPSPDPFSMLLLAVPCVVLVEASEVFAWANDRRRARHGSLQFPGLSDEQVHEYGLDQPLVEPSEAGTGASAS